MLTTSIVCLAALLLATGQASAANFSSPATRSIAELSKLGLPILTAASPNFTAEATAYWSVANRELLPQGVLVPTRAEDVAQAIPILVKNQANFNIKSGGHATKRDENTAKDGILITMSKMRQFNLDTKTGIARIGPGWQWGELYSKLEPYNRTAVGGRYSTVGVGGLLLGGGISHLSNKYGLSAANVVNYEVVLASGKIVHANKDKNQDLFWALKGGSSNFGIVTRFDIQTVKQAQIWGGTMLVTTENLPSLYAAIDEFQAVGQLDQNAAIVPSFIYVPTGGHVCSILLYYGEPTPYPESLKMFWSLPGAANSTLRLTTHADLSVELGGQGSSTTRNQFYTGTVTAGNGTSASIVDAFLETSKDSALVSTRLVASLSLQPMSLSMMASSAAADYPATYLSPNPSTWWIVTVQYESKDEDDAFTGYLQDTSKNVVSAVAQQNCGAVPKHLYLNDAGEGQDPIQGYGGVKVQRLRRISRHYDPHGVFQNLVSGYKLK